MGAKLRYIFLFFSWAVTAQTVADNTGFKAVDSIARTYKYEGDLKLLVSQLTDGYDTDLLKARAIFAWVADNIAYDIKAYNKNKKPKPFKCRNKENCDAERQAYEDAYIEEVLSSGKGVCQGYANLFKRMCNYAGLETDVLSGYVKQSKGMVGKMGHLNHAWNGIVLNGQYYYIDATWAAGNCSKDKKGKLEKFNKEFNEYYWLTPADVFFRNHYPKDKTPHTSRLTKQQYKDAAYMPGWMLPCASVLKPESGVLQAFMGDTLHFEVAYTCDYSIEKLQVNTNRKHNPSVYADREKGEISQSALKKQEYINFTNAAGLLRFDYVVTEKNIKYIEVLADHTNLLLKFNITVTEYLIIFGKKVYPNQLRIP